MIQREELVGEFERDVDGDVDLEDFVVNPLEDDNNLRDEHVDSDADL